jgi:hypothetical protein
MAVSLHKDLSLSAASALGHTVFLPSGIRIRVLAVSPLPSRVRLVGRTANGGTVAATLSRSATLRPAQGI